MILPAKGTLERLVLDTVNTKTRMGMETLSHYVNKTSRPSLQIICDKFIQQGLMRMTNGSFATTKEAKKAIIADDQRIVEALREFKPLKPRANWKDRVMRPGATEFMDWQSKHY